MDRSLSILKTIAAGLLSVVLVLVVVLRLTVGSPSAESSAPDPVETSGQEITEPAEAVPRVNYTLRIREVMGSNKSVLADSAGNFPDWIELQNTGDKDLSLEGCILTCAGSSWTFPAVTIPAGGYMVVACDGEGLSDLGDCCADFTVPKEGAEIGLFSPDRRSLDSLTFAALEADTSVTVADDGSQAVTDYPTPGQANTPAGFSAFQSSLPTAGPLVINEVMTYNGEYLKTNKTFYDWIEIRNVSSSPVSLSGYYLSDSSSDRARWALPDVELGAGELYIVYCVDDAETAEKDPSYAPFGLSALEDRLYLSAADGTLVDYVHLKNLRLGGSMGRLEGENGFWYFEQPTPDGDNAGTCARSIAVKPAALESDGVFNDVSSVTVTLVGDGDIHYTTDGSVPTADSPLYTAPLTLTQTGVVRAIQVQEGCLPSESLDLSYILNENHTVPVVSLVMDPSEFDTVYNVTSQKLEREATVAFFEEDGSFRIDCGIRLHGNASKTVLDKKSLKLCFRSRYDGNLEYDLFGNGVTDFSSLLLRSAMEDVYSTQLRDCLMHRLAIAAFPELPAQDNQYAVLYINGEYWGLYNIREAHSETHYANHYGYDEDDIVQWEQIWDASSPINTAYNFAMSHDLSIQENYEEVAQVLDIDSVIAWCIIEAYSGNFDAHSENMRFYYNKQTGIVSYALVDLDLGMFRLNYYNTCFTYGYAFQSLAYKLMENAGFKQQFLSTLGQALTTTLSDENVHAEIEKLADIIRPEIARDHAKWGSDEKGWEKLVDRVRDYVDRDGGRASAMVRNLTEYISLSAEEKQTYFSGVQ